MKGATYFCQSFYCKNRFYMLYYNHYGKDMALSLFPLKNKQEIEKALKQNFEAETLIYRKGNLPIFEIQNIKPYLKNIESQNVLSCKQLLELADILRLSNNLKKYFLSTEIDMTEFTALSRVI